MSESSFRIVSLSEDEAAQCLPLIRITWPDVDLEHWRRFVRSYTAQRRESRSGALALRDAADYFSAMFAYRVEPDIQRGLVLAVHLFTAVDLTNSPNFARMLVSAAEAKARELGCSGIEIRLYRAQSTLALHLQSLKLVDSAAIMSKSVR